MRVLLTGGSGFLGSRTRASLESAGLEVHAPSRSDMDLLAPGGAAQVVQQLRPTHLIHLAWHPSIEWRSDDTAHDRWTTATLSLLETFVKSGGRRAGRRGSPPEPRYGTCCMSTTARTR